MPKAGDVLLEFGVRGSLAVVFPIPVEGAVPLGVGWSGVSGGVADVALVSPELEAVHLAGGVPVPGADNG